MKRFVRPRILRSLEKSQSSVNGDGVFVDVLELRDLAV